MTGESCIDISDVSGAPEPQMGAPPSPHFLLTQETGPESWGEWALQNRKGAESQQARLSDQKEWRGWSRPRQETLGQMEMRL